jgi:toxin ParE1/3/4
MRSRKGAQRDRDEAALVRAFAHLAVYADLGERRPGLFPGCHAHVVGRHVLYYRVTNDTGEVVRILHERADPTRHLQP